MMRYKDGEHLSRLFHMWARKHNAAPCPESVIAWLQVHDLLNEEKVIVFLERHERPAADYPFVAKRSLHRPVTATEAVEIHRRLFDIDDFKMEQSPEWQKFFMGIFEVSEPPRQELHCTDPLRDKMDHWVTALYYGNFPGNLHDSEKDAGSEQIQNDISKEDESK